MFHRASPVPNRNSQVQFAGSSMYFRATALPKVMPVPSKSAPSPLRGDPRWRGSARGRGAVGRTPGPRSWAGRDTRRGGGYGWGRSHAQRLRRLRFARAARPLKRFSSRRRSFALGAVRNSEHYSIKLVAPQLHSKRQGPRVASPSFLAAISQAFPNRLDRCGLG